MLPHDFTILHAVLMVYAVGFIVMLFICHSIIDKQFPSESGVTVLISALLVALGWPYVLAALLVQHHLGGKR